MSEQRKKLGLALGSGGARGFCHIGVLEVLEQNGIEVDFISGCSMGAMVGGCYCSGVTVGEMKSAAAKITQRTIMDVSISQKKMGLVKGQRGLNVIKKMIGDRTFDECRIPFRATAADVRTGNLVVFDEGKLVDAIRASISMPAIIHAVTAESEDDEPQLLVDGGILERIPIDACRAMGADVVVAVDALGPLRENYDPKGIVGMIERAYLMLDWESTREKVKSADLVISPEQGDRSLIVFKDNEFSIECGRKAAEEMLPRIRELLEA